MSGGLPRLFSVHAVREELFHDGLIARGGGGGVVASDGGAQRLRGEKFGGAVLFEGAKAFAGISPFRFFKKASPAMIFAFTSTSSAATIPLSKECADELGAENDVSSFVIPLGATINMDGTAIYQCVATIFLATCCGMTLTLGQMVTIVVTATLASIGTAGTPGAGMIMLAMVLEAMNIPVDMIMIIYGIDRLFDMGRTCLNITGDISCALCVSKWESEKAAQTAK